MPLAILHGGLGIVNGVTARFSLAGMQTMVKNLFTWGLGITMTILTGVTVITGVTGKAFTGLGSKTLRFAAGSMVPVVGRYMAEAADAVFNSASIIKDTAGAGVMAGILLICAAPFIKILAMVIVYRLIAVLVQPVSDERIGNAITAAADSMTMIMGLMALIGMLFVLNTAVFVSLGSSI
jgi:stage III sporulation protein AE